MTQCAAAQQLVREETCSWRATATFLLVGRRVHYDQSLFSQSGNKIVFVIHKVRLQYFKGNNDLIDTANITPALWV